MRRIITLPQEIYALFAAHCLLRNIRKSVAARLAVSVHAKKDVSRQGSALEGRWSQDYNGCPGRRIAVVLHPEFDMAIRQSATKWRKSINAYYALAIQEWLVSEGAGPVALQTPLVR